MIWLALYAATVCAVLVWGGLATGADERDSEVLATVLLAVLWPLLLVMTIGAAVRGARK